LQKVFPLAIRFLKVISPPPSGATAMIHSFIQPTGSLFACPPWSLFARPNKALDKARHQGYDQRLTDPIAHQEN
jgi:hypothetical protein